MTRFKVGVIAAAALCCAPLVAADPVMHVWTCELAEGKTTEDVKAVNDRWLAFVADEIDDADVQSSIASTIVGDTTKFLFLDRFPDLETWAAVGAALDSDAGQAIEAAFDEVSPCSTSTLYQLMESG